MKRKKVVYIVSDVEKALAFEWVAAHFTSRVDLFFLLIGKKKTALTSYVASINVRYTVVSDEEYGSSLRVWMKIIKILKIEKPDVVHTHLWRATLLGITASWVLRVKKRIFTRHHATIHYKQYPSGRKWDRLCNALATDIIAISQNIKSILLDWDKADASKVQIIHHGFDLDYFIAVDEARVEMLRRKYHINDGPVVGAISRYFEWKGIQYIIPAFKFIRQKYPTAHLILANAHGPFAAEIKRQLTMLDSGSYTEITFENDPAALYRLFDVFVHVPVDPHAEAFGQTYIETMAAGVPSVVTLSGVAGEFIRHEHNALVVDYQRSDEIAAAIERLLTDQPLARRLTAAAQSSLEQFSLAQMLKKLEDLYG